MQDTFNIDKPEEGYSGEDQRLIRIGLRESLIQSANESDILYYQIYSINKLYIPGNAVKSGPLTRQRAIEFVTIIRNFLLEKLNESKESRNNYNFVGSVFEDLTDEQKENLVDHELAHIDAITQSGIDISQFQFICFFTSGMFGKGFLLYLDISNLPPIIQIKSAISPRQLSQTDLGAVHRLIKSNYQLLKDHPEDYVIINKILIEKTGRDIEWFIMTN